MRLQIITIFRGSKLLLFTMTAQKEEIVREGKILYLLFKNEIKGGENTVGQLSNEYYRKILFKTLLPFKLTSFLSVLLFPLPSQIQVPLALQMALLS